MMPRFSKTGSVTEGERTLMLSKGDRNPEKPYSSAKNRRSSRKYSLKTIKNYIHYNEELLYIM